MNSPEENPWTTLSTKDIYENPWIKVKEDQVLNPSNNPGIYTTVHFKNTALGIIPLDEDGNTWLVGQYRYPLNEYSWEIPMGGGAAEEIPLAAAKRELKEETGLVAEKWEVLMKIHTSNSVTDEVGFIYLAQNLQQQETATEETEQLQLWKLPFSEALQMALNGKITDSISVAGILKLSYILNR